MANTFLTCQQIAREALLRLQSNMVMGGLVYTDYSKEFKEQGDTIQIRKPATFIADEFGGTINLQDVGEKNVLVSLDKIADVSVEVGSKELTLNVSDFGAQILDGATLAIAEKMDQDLCGLYKQVPYYAGVGGTTPSSLTDISNVMLVLNNNRVPMSNRVAVFDPYAQAKLVTIDSIARADASGSTAALREASIGRILGFDTYMDQNVKKQTAGAFTALTDVTGAATTGSTTITLTSAAKTSTGDIKQGDAFTIAGQQFVVTSDAVAVGGVVTVNVYPAVGAAISNQAVSFAKNHTASMAFHKNAFALVTRPLEPPMGGAESYVATAPNGMSLRVTMGYNMDTKKNIVSIDILYGVKAIYPELATRILG
ncbi:P22 phage major capsid protein family protein [Clostridium beijerinckii]|uniref:P22 phage major capsid protein family protein n=1 Tax=Clostridium beijerinckii TaxID=1520 RepID=UPI00047EAD98|nr:P22 phage major capsid protein family protein [Clostridium beijerinckii]